MDPSQDIRDRTFAFGCVIAKLALGMAVRPGVRCIADQLLRSGTWPTQDDWRPRAMNAFRSAGFSERLSSVRRDAGHEVSSHNSKRKMQKDKGSFFELFISNFEFRLAS